MRPIKKTIKIEIEVTPDERWSRCRMESDAGDVSIKSFSREFAHGVIGLIEREINSFVEDRLPEYEEDHMLEYSLEEFDWDPEYKKYTDMVKEVKINGFKITE